MDEDIYTKNGINYLLEEDAVTSEEEGFMLGYLEEE